MVTTICILINCAVVIVFSDIYFTLKEADKAIDLTNDPEKLLSYICQLQQRIDELENGLPGIDINTFFHFLSFLPC